MSSRALALRALEQWRSGSGFADAVLHELLSNSHLAAADRAFTTELFYGVLRNRTLLDFWIGCLRSGSLDHTSREILRLGLYQLLLLQTPEHAAVFETVQLAGRRARGLINGVLRSATRRTAELHELATQQPLHVRASHPEFLVNKWERQFGLENLEALCLWDNRPASVYARVNELKTTVAKFLAVNSGSSTLPGQTHFVDLPHPRPALEAGTCYMQDPSTGIACELLAPEPGELVLDACAAPGGKTSYLAALMQNRGTIVACDRDPFRIATLRSNLERLGVTNTQTVECDWLSAENLPAAVTSVGTYDRILLDAPCSNTGVMRRRVDVRWRLSPADFARMREQQLAIVRRVLPLLKSGGTLVYSTCSLEPEENELVIACVAAEYPDVQPREVRASLPFRDGMDGAFSAQLVR